MYSIWPGRDRGVGRLDHVSLFLMMPFSTNLDGYGGVASSWLMTFMASNRPGEDAGTR